MTNPSTCWWLISERLCLPSGEWSAWVQGVGSLLAVIVAIAIPLWQRHADRAAKQWAEAEQLGKTRMLYDALAGECSLLAAIADPNKLKRPVDLSRNIKAFNECVNWLDNLTIEDFPDAPTFRIHLLLAAELLNSSQMVSQLITIQLHTNDGKAEAKYIANNLNTLQAIAECVSESFAAHERRLTISITDRTTRFVFSHFTRVSRIFQRPLKDAP